MVLISYSGREINAKLVYYGPGLSGKTTNLEYIYGAVPQTHRGQMVSMKTKTERTLFFDFLPIDLGELAGFKTRFLLYTVPGQVYYNATRKLVLKGVDAVVFVADSKRGKMEENLDSLANLRENLREHGIDLDQVPWVIQYNKRDLSDVYSLEELETALNPRRVPSFEAVATSGQGVFETFKAISRLLLKHLSQEIGVRVVASPGDSEKTAPVAEPAIEAPVAPEGAKHAGPEPAREEIPLREPAPPAALAVDEERVEAPMWATGADSLAESAAAPWTRAAGGAVAERAIEAVTEPQLELMAEAVAEPVAEAVAEPVAGSVAESSAESVAEIAAGQPDREEASAPQPESVWNQEMLRANPLPADASPEDSERSVFGPSESEDTDRPHTMGERLRRWFGRGHEFDEREELDAHHDLVLEGHSEPDGEADLDVGDQADGRAGIDAHADLHADADVASYPDAPTSGEEEIEQLEPSHVATIESAMHLAAIRIDPASSHRSEAERREIPILVDLEPEDLERGVVLKLRIAMRKREGEEQDEGDSVHRRAA